MSLPTPLAPTTSYFLGIPPADGRYRHPPDSPPSSVYRGSHRGLSPLGRHRPLATSQESLIPVGPTRSFSMPLHDYASSTGSLNNFGLSPAPSSRPLYVRGATTINNITGLNVMSDDEREKRALQSAISQTGTDGSSAQGPGASRRKADSADKVRKMVDNLTRKCAEKEMRIKALEWQLTDELSRSRQLSESISDVNKRLESRHAMFAEIIKHTMPSMTRKLETTRNRSSSVNERLPKLIDGLNKAQNTYDKDRLRAIALEQHLQWRTTPWYTKAKMYLRGDRTLNWHDKSSHRWQVLIMIVTWVFLIALALVGVAILVYLFFWYQREQVL